MKHSFASSLKFSSVAIAFAGVVLAPAAQAQGFYGTFGFEVSGTIRTDTSNTLTTATTKVTLSKTKGRVSSVPDTYGTQTNGFASTENGSPTDGTNPLTEDSDMVTLSTAIIKSGTNLNISFSDDNAVAFSFAGSGITVTAAPNSFQFDEHGTITFGHTTESADLSGVFNQGSGGVITGGFSLNVAPNLFTPGLSHVSSTPEPNAVALIAGCAITGAGFLTRPRRRNG